MAPAASIDTSDGVDAETIELRRVLVIAPWPVGLVGMFLPAPRLRCYSLQTHSTTHKRLRPSC